MTAVAEVRGVSLSFGSVAALSDVSFSCAAGAVTGLVGPNGSGKSTTLRVIAGLLVPDRGEARVEGLDPRNEAARRALALVPDKATGLDELTILEYIDVFLALHKRSDAMGVALDLLEAFRLTDRADHSLGTLSAGMRRQVTIAAAAALRPRLLLVDEATASLDPEAVVVLRTIVAQLARNGSAVLVATQDLGFAEKVCDRVVMLLSGVVQVDGPTEDEIRRFAAEDLEGVLLKVAERSAMVDEVRDALAAD